MDEKDVRKTGHSFGTSVIIIFLMAFLVGVIVFSIGFVVFKRYQSPMFTPKSFVSTFIAVEFQAKFLIEILYC